MLCTSAPSSLTSLPAACPVQKDPTSELYRDQALAPILLQPSIPTYFPGILPSATYTILKISLSRSPQKSSACAYSISFHLIPFTLKNQLLRLVLPFSEALLSLDSWSALNVTLTAATVSSGVFPVTYQRLLLFSPSFKARSLWITH